MLGFNYKRNVCCTGDTEDPVGGVDGENAVCESDAIIVIFHLRSPGCASVLHQYHTSDFAPTHPFI